MTCRVMSSSLPVCSAASRYLSAMRDCARTMQARIVGPICSAGSRVICGVVTNNSVEATVRMAGNLGFDALLVEDACFTFGKRDWSGQLRSADEVHAMSLANLDGEYCRVVNSKSLPIG